MLLYIIRHGEPDYQTDTLTPRGKEQAEALGERLSKIHFDRLYSSPMGRARQTAEPTARRLGLEVGIEDWASEALAWRDFHRTVPDPEEPNSWVFIQPNYKFHTPENRLRNDDWAECDCLHNGGEGFNPAGMERIRSAADAFLARFGYVREGGMYRISNPSEERIALFCHGGFGSCLLGYLLDMPHQLFWSSFTLMHTGVCILYFRNYPGGKTCPKVLAMNDLAHLEGTGLKPEYHEHDF